MSDYLLDDTDLQAMQAQLMNMQTKTLERNKEEEDLDEYR